MGLDKINEFKKELGLTNAEISKISGIPKSTIDKITSGNTPAPKLSTVKSIMAALGKTINDLDDFDEILNVTQMVDGMPLSNDEQEIIRSYRQLSDEGKDIARKSMLGLIAGYKKASGSVEMAREIAI